MLGKLMKYEFKATSRLLVPLYLILLVMSIFNRFAFWIYDNNTLTSIISQFLVVIYVTSIFAVLIATFIYMITRFYKNLLTDEGYLMFTLPAKAHELITSKLLSTICWTIISFAAVIISLFIAFATPDTLSAAVSAFKEVIATGEFGASWAFVFTELIVIFLLNLISSILLIYASIAIGQLFTKHKIIGSFAAYMIINTVLQFVMLIIVTVFGVFMPKYVNPAALMPHVIFPLTIVILIIGCAGFYLVTNYIFTRKLNLD